MKGLIVLCIAGFLLSGCVNGQWKGIAGYVDHLNGIEEPKMPPEAENVKLPSSGIPSVIIQGYDKEQLIEKIAFNISSRGGSAIADLKVTDYEISIDKEMEGTRNALMYGSKYNSVPHERLILFFATESEKAIYVTGKSYIVTNPKSPYEKRRINNSIKEKKGIQLILNKLKQRMEDKETRN